MRNGQSAVSCWSLKAKVALPEMGFYSSLSTVNLRAIRAWYIELRDTAHHGLGILQVPDRNL